MRRLNTRASWAADQVTTEVTRTGFQNAAPATPAATGVNRSVSIADRHGERCRRSVARAGAWMVRAGARDVLRDSAAAALLARAFAERAVNRTRLQPAGLAFIKARRARRWRARDRLQILQFLRATVLVAQRGQELPLPAIEIVGRDDGEQRLMARAPLFQRHGQGLRDRMRNRFRIIRIDQQGAPQIDRRAGESRQNKNAGIFGVLRGDVLLG